MVLHKSNMQKKVVTGKMGRYYKIKYEKVVTGMMDGATKIDMKKSSHWKDGRVLHKFNMKK